MEKYPAFGVYCLFALGLVVLLFVLDGLNAVVRVKTKTAINPEDKAKDARVVEEDVGDVQRACVGM